MQKVSSNKNNSNCKRIFPNHFAYIFYDFLKVTMSEKICMKKRKTGLKCLFLNIFKKS